MEDKDRKSVLEALLFLSGEVLAASAVKDILEIPEAEIKRCMEEIDVGIQGAEYRIDDRRDSEWISDGYQP